MISLQFEIIEQRTNNMFELATQEEVDKLGTSGGGGGLVSIPVKANCSDIKQTNLFCSDIPISLQVILRG